jgi:diguanylate cyclase (GGDEF)-like protein
LRRAEEIRQGVESTPVELRRSVTTTTVSIGVATFPQDGSTGEELLRVADEQLYRAKAKGRNRVCAIGGVESGV